MKFSRMAIAAGLLAFSEVALAFDFQLRGGVRSIEADEEAFDSKDDTSGTTVGASIHHGVNRKIPVYLGFFAEHNAYVAKPTSEMKSDDTTTFDDTTLKGLVYVGSPGTELEFAL